MRMKVVLGKVCLWSGVVCVRIKVVFGVFV